MPIVIRSSGNNRSQSVSRNKVFPNVSHIAFYGNRREFVSSSILIQQLAQQSAAQFGNLVTEFLVDRPRSTVPHGKFST